MRMEEFELDSILAEFSDHPEKQQEAATDEPAEPKPQGSQRETAHEAETPAVPERKEIPSEKPQSGTQVFHVPENDTQIDRETYADKNQTDKTGQKKTKAAGKDKNQPKKKKEGFFQRLGFGVLSLIFAALSLAALLWTLQNVSPDTSPMDHVEKGTATTDLVARLDTSINNSKANALSGIAYIPKHYSIPESDTVAPAPEEANFGSVSPDDAAAVMDIIQEARDSGLLEGQNVIFSPELNFRRDTEIKYYYDETILMILWKEIIDGNTVTCCEVKIADASQFRRKITDDTFGSSTKLFATSLSNSVNAVVAMNADFYMFRDFGIVVYNRELYRFGESVYTGNYKKYNCTDTLFINGSGDFLFWHRLQEASAAEMRQFIVDNDIVFSIAFGPILVENGELKVCDWYPAGEIDRGYSRAGIGQMDSLHYFYMSLNHSPEKEARWTVNKFGEQMYARGLQQAYCLDGGQTSEVVFRGTPYNYIDFGGEREVSDIIYFATALPEKEAVS